MTLWLKKPASAGDTTGTYVKPSAFWVKKPSFVGDTVGTFVKVLKGYVKSSAGWQLFWPKEGPSATTSPLISTVSSDLNGLYQPSGFTLDYGATYYAQKGIWESGSDTSAISSYSYTVWTSSSSAINTSPLDIMDSGSLPGDSLTLQLTNGLTSGTSYDGKYLIFGVRATRADGAVGNDNTDSQGYRYAICRKYAPTEASGYTPTISTPGVTTTNTTLSGGLLVSRGAPLTLSYSNGWNGTTDYLPDSTRSSVKWYSSLNGTYTTAAQVIANGTLITSGVTTPSPSNSGGVYSTSSTYITGSTIPNGTYYYVIDSQQNSNTDINVSGAVNKVTVFGPVKVSPGIITQPTLTAITPAGYIGKTNSFTVGATVYGNTGIWNPTPNGNNPVVSSFKYSTQSSISNQANWDFFNFNSGGSNGSGTLYAIQDTNENQTHSFTLPATIYNPAGTPMASSGKYLEYMISAENGSGSLASDYYTNSQQVYPVPTAVGAPVLTNYTESNGNVTANKATVYWAPGLYSSSYYELQYSLNNSTNWTTVYPTPNNQITAIPGVNSQLVYTGLPNTAYYRTVAYNADGVGIQSSSTTYFDSNPPAYQFTIGNNLYVGTNGYVSFDQGNTTYNITQTVGRVLGFLPADLQLDYLKYAAIKDVYDYWYVVWQGRRLGSSTNSELRVELLFQSGAQYAWAYYTIGSGVTGTFVSYPYGFYKDGVGIKTSTGGISNGSNVMYSLNTASGFLALPPSWFPYGTTWAGLNVLTGSAGVSSGTVDDGYYLMSTFAAYPPVWISSTVTAPTANMTTTTAYLFWTPPQANGGSEISSYDYKIGSGGTWINVGNTTLTQLTGLTPGTQYTVYLRARNYGYGFASTDPNNIYWTSVTFTTPSAPGNFNWSILSGSTVPTTPNTPTLTQNGNYILVDWASSKPSNTAQYTEYYSGSAVFGTPSSIVWGNINNYSSAPAYNYPTGPYDDYFIIQSTANNSGFNVYVTARGIDKKALVTWGASTNAGSYKVTYTISGASAGNGTFTSAATTNTYLYIDTTTNGGTVTVNSVIAYSNNDGTGSSTNGTMDIGPSRTPDYATATSGTASGNFTYTAPAPGIPTNFAATTTRSDGVNLTWTASTGSPTSYEIYWNVSGGGAPTAGSTPDFSGITGTSYLDTTISAGGTRDYWVRARNAGGASDWSARVTGTRIVAISNATPPTSVNASGGNGSATVSWSGSTNAVKYRIWWSTSSTGYASDPSTSYDAETTSTSYTFSGLTNGTTYYFWVSASNTNNVWTNYSSSPRGQATPSAPTGTAPTTPTGLSNSYSSGPSWTGSWSASSGTATITYYWTLYQSTSNGGSVTATASGSTTGTSFTQSMNSANGLWAYFTVYASNAYGSSGTATSGWA